MTKRLVVEAMVFLIRTEWAMHWHRDRPLYEVLKSTAPRTVRNNRHSAEEICHSMDVACLIYLKPVLCLQRSVAVALLLRRYGFSAQVVIGARIALSTFHAWVVLGEQVLNDRPYTPQMYSELVRC